MTLTPEVAGYTAGILDGEGTVTLNLRKAPRSTDALVVVGNTDERMLLWLQSHLGGVVSLAHRADAHCRTTWTWRLYSINARRLLRAILPLLVVKRRHAELVLAFHDAAERQREGNRSGRSRITVDTEPFASIFADLRALNRKGPHSP